MKTKKIFIFIILILMFAYVSNAEYCGGYVGGEVLVGFVNSDDRTQWLCDHGLIQDGSPILSGTHYRARLPPGCEEPEAANALQGFPEVNYVEPNYRAVPLVDGPSTPCDPLPSCTYSFSALADCSKIPGTVWDDVDNDGVYAYTDCDDNDPSIPTTEVCDGVDNDCDTQIDENLANVIIGELGICSVNTRSCVSGSWVNNNEVTPTTEGCNGLDDDCDGSTDEGGMCLIDNDIDGFYTNYGDKIDCDDSNPNINPDYIGDLFDGKDNDCDGEIDEDSYWKHQDISLNPGSFCTKTSFLSCTVISGNVVVYQNLSHIENGNYEFSLDLLAGMSSSINVLVTTKAAPTTDLCLETESLGVLSCSINGLTTTDNKLDIKLILTGNANIDNAKLFKQENIAIANNLGIQDNYDLTPVSCCPADYCWDGTSCVSAASYAADSQKPPLFKAVGDSGYRCVINATTRLAEWMNSTLKYDPYEKNAGYCPTSDMCFATTTNPDTNGLIGGCANNNYFVTTNQNPFSGMDLDEEYQDFVCEDGYWGSRTRQNALDMVKMADGSRFLLFCDQARSSCGVDKSINYFNIPTPLNDFLGNPTSCILSDKQKLFTNFCALVIDDSSNSDRGEIFDDADKTIISFGIRKQLSDAVLQKLLISAFGTDCQGATLTNNYVDCSATNGNLFFNNETWTFMYSKDNINNEISSFATHTISTRIWLFITNIFSSIWDFIVGEQEIIVNLQESMLSRVGAYNQIYFAKTSYGEIQAVMIRKQSNLSSNEGLVDVVQATMYNYTYCEETTTNNYKLDLSLQGDLIFNQEIYNSVGVQSYNCTKTGDITTITWVGKTNARIESNWLDITARIRPQN